MSRWMSCARRAQAGGDPATMAEWPAARGAREFRRELGDVDRGTCEWLSARVGRGGLDAGGDDAQSSVNCWSA